MSRDASLTRDFAGKKARLFRLGLDQWLKIDDTCGFGPTGAAVLFKKTAVALDAVANADPGLLADPARQVLARAHISVLAEIDHRNLARTLDVRTVILWALEGGGMPLPDADNLVRIWVDDRPVVENLDLAYALAMATLVQVGDDDLGESAGEPETASPSSPAAD
jgi:hypothetical protein